MGPNVVTQTGMLAMLAALATSEDSPLASAKVSLFINDVDPGKEALDGDFDPATFTTSTAVAITWGEQYLNANGDAEVSSQLIQFDWDSGDAETVYGIVIRDGADPTKVYGYARLDVGKEMGTTNDSLAVVVRLTLSDDGFGASVQVSE